jgi:hypothetical protein
MSDEREGDDGGVKVQLFVGQVRLPGKASNFSLFLIPCLLRLLWVPNRLVGASDTLYDSSGVA